MSGTPRGGRGKEQGLVGTFSIKSCRAPPTHIMVSQAWQLEAVKPKPSNTNCNYMRILLISCVILYTKHTCLLWWWISIGSMAEQAMEVVPISKIWNIQRIMFDYDRKEAVVLTSYQTVGGPRDILTDFHYQRQLLSTQPVAAKMRINHWVVMGKSNAAKFILTLSRHRIW